MQLRAPSPTAVVTVHVRRTARVATGSDAVPPSGHCGQLAREPAGSVGPFEEAIR